MMIRDLEELLQIQVLSGQDRLQTPVQGVLVSDILSDVMAKAGQGWLWVTHQTTVNVIAIAFFKGLAGVILPDRLQLRDDALAKAVEKEIPVLSSDLSAYQVIGVLYQMGLKG